MRNITPHEFTQLLEAIPPRSPFGARDHAMLRLAYHAGLRVGELVGIEVGLVWVRGQPTGWLELPASACKGRRSRAVPLSLAAQAAVVDLVAFLRRRGFSAEPSAPLLTDRHHRPLPAREVQRAVQRYREAAGLTATPHTLRHGFASRLIAERVSLRVVQQLLGHHSIRSTEVYLHSQPEELVRAVNLV